MTRPQPQNPSSDDLRQLTRSRDLEACAPIPRRESLISQNDEDESHNQLRLSSTRAPAEPRSPAQPGGIDSCPRFHPTSYSVLAQDGTEYGGGGAESSPIFEPSRGSRLAARHIKTAISRMPSNMNYIPSAQPRNSLLAPPIVQSKAHELKMMTNNQNTNLPATGRKCLQPEHDPENYEIKRLRTEERMSWGAIAEKLNRDRVSQGKSPIFTEAAVYGRFVRNGPRIAQVVGEEFSPKDYMHIRTEKDRPRGGGTSGYRPGPHFTAADDEMLVEAYGDVQVEFWGRVAEVMEIRSGKRYEPDECASRYAKI